MPRNGSLVLSDLAHDALWVVCDCGRSGRYSVTQLLAKHGDARLTDLLTMISADCPKRAAANILDQCKARFEFEVDPKS